MSGRRRYRLAIQAGVVLALGGLAALLVFTSATNLQQRGIQSGFDFLRQPAGFAIGESWLAFDSGDSYLRAFAAGIANTLRVALPAMVLSTVLGIVLGIGRLSPNILLRAACRAYVETLRNIPLLLQLLAWYFILTDLLPDNSAAIAPLPGIFLSKSGLTIPWFGSAGSGFEIPLRGEFTVIGGATLTPEYTALLLGLSLYTAAYIGETVRAGILAVPRGQSDAARALGMDDYSVYRLVVMPQALRSIVPPLTNTHLSLLKNSSLAVAIGYPDLVSIANTTINQTGRAVECIILIMIVYLVISLMAAGSSRWFERRTGHWARAS